MKRMNGLALSPAAVVFSYSTLQGKPLSTSPVEHCSAKLVPFALCKFFFYFCNNLSNYYKKNLAARERS